MITDREKYLMLWAANYFMDTHDKGPVNYEELDGGLGENISDCHEAEQLLTHEADKYAEEQKAKKEKPHEINQLTLTAI